MDIFDKILEFHKELLQSQLKVISVLYYFHRPPDMVSFSSM